MVSAAGLVLVIGSAAAAQEPISAPSTPALLSRYDFHLSAAALQIDDPRFTWDVHFGGDLDVVDYVRGRTSLVIDYEAILGNQLRAFDPNQGTYTLEVSSSYRIRNTEVALMFHHVSRHLGDRPKTFAIAWNVVGARVLRHLNVRSTSVDVDADYGRMIEHADVDYTWASNADLSFRHELSNRAGVFARGAGHLIGVDSAVRSRGTQTGGRVEAGIRLSGTEGVVELFAGMERRIDAAPTDFQSASWTFVGFRLVRH